MISYVDLFGGIASDPVISDEQKVEHDKLLDQLYDTGIMYREYIFQSEGWCKDIQVFRNPVFMTDEDDMSFDQDIIDFLSSLSSVRNAKSSASKASSEERSAEAKYHASMQDVYSTLNKTDEDK